MYYNTEVIKMKKIIANNDKKKYALVDDDIYETIQKMRLKFYINNQGYWYSTTEIQLPGMNKKKRLLLHVFVFTLKTGELPNKTVDHQDRDKLNNQYCNLRLATRKEQSQNQGKMKNNTSGYIGVCHHHKVDKHNNKPWSKDYWLARIQNPDGKNEQKYFPFTENGKQHAAMWYDTKAIEYYGDFHGELNFPNDN